MFSVIFMSILDKILNKRGITQEQLDPEEKETFENWRKILSKEELTIKDVKEFCQSQVSVIEGKWSDLNTSQEKKAEFIPYHTIYKTLLLTIDSPKIAREQLENQLNQLIK